MLLIVLWSQAQPKNSAETTLLTATTKYFFLSNSFGVCAIDGKLVLDDTLNNTFSTNSLFKLEEKLPFTRCMCYDYIHRI